MMIFETQSAFNNFVGADCETSPIPGFTPLSISHATGRVRAYAVPVEGPHRSVSKRAAMSSIRARARRGDVMVGVISSLRLPGMELVVTT